MTALQVEERSGRQRREQPSEDGAGSAPAAAAALVTRIDSAPYRRSRASTRQQASQLLSAVEGFFRQVEPSSPMPTSAGPRAELFRQGLFARSLTN